MGIFAGTQSGLGEAMQAGAAPTQADIWKTVAKPQGTITSQDMGVLISGLNNTSTAKICGETLGKLAKERPELFTEDAVKLIFAGFRDNAVAGYCSRIFASLAAGDSQVAVTCRKLLFDGLETAGLETQCADALAILSNLKPGLFSEEMVDAIIRGLHKPKSAKGCALALGHLACAVEGEMQKACIDALFEGLKTKAGAFCAEALAYIARTRPELLYAHVGELTAGLEGNLSAPGCAEALGFLARANNEIAGKCVDALIGGMTFEWAQDGCTEALRNVAFAKPLLFTEKRVEALLHELVDDGIGAVAIVLEEILASSKQRTGIVEKCLAALVDGMLSDDNDFGAKCSDCVSRLAYRNAAIFTEGEVKLLISYMGKPGVGKAAAEALAFLIWHSDLMDGHADVLVQGTKNAETAPACYHGLMSIAVKNPESMYQYIDVIIAGLGNGEAAADCANALAFMVEKDERSRKRLLELWPTLGKKEVDALEKRNLTEYHLTHAKDLKDKFNIEYFTRYPQPILEGMLSGKRDEAKPLAIVAYAKTDWNGALYDDTMIRDLYDAGYQVVVFECATDYEFIEKMGYVTGKDRNGKDITGKEVMDWGQATLLGISAHGWEMGSQWDSQGGAAGTLETMDSAVFAAMPNFMIPSRMFGAEGAGQAGFEGALAQYNAENRQGIVFGEGMLDDVFVQLASNPSKIVQVKDTNGDPYLLGIDEKGNACLYRNLEIVLNSCSTGNREVLDNLAAAVSGKVGYAHLFAPDKPGEVRDIVFGRDSKGRPYITHVDYVNTAGTEYIGGKIRAFYK